MKTTKLFNIALIAVTMFSFFACTNPNGTETPADTWELKTTGVEYYDSDSIVGRGGWETQDPSFTPQEAIWAGLTCDDENGIKGLATRSAEGTLVRDDIWWIKTTGEEETRTVIIALNKSFTQERILEPNEKVENGEIRFKSGTVIDDHKDGEHTFGDWDYIGSATNWLDKDDIDGGNYGDIVNEDGTPFAPDTSNEYEYQLRKQIRYCTADDGGFEERWVMVGEREITTTTEITLSNGTPGVADIDTRTAITNTSINSSGIVNNEFVDWSANGIVKSLLHKLSGQAAQLEEFFEGSSDHFDALQTKEGEIKNKVTDTTPEAYLDCVNGGEAALISFIERNATPGQFAAFNVLWNGYKAGHYLITRDWRTEIGGPGTYDQTQDYDEEGNLAEYRAAATVATGAVPSGDFNNTRQVFIPGMGNPYSILPDIEDALVNAGVTGLGMDAGVAGDDDTQVEKMFRALVRQFGQDNEEFRAFYDDIETVGLDAADETYHATLGQATLN